MKLSRNLIQRLAETLTGLRKHAAMFNRETDEMWVAVKEAVEAVEAEARAYLATPEPAAGPTPIPLSERLPEPDDCDAEGRCWFGYRERTVDAVIFGETIEKYGPTYPAEWVFTKLPFNPEEMSEPPVIWLPHNALPLPEIQP